MKDYIFLFDLDSTITKKEILPSIAKEIGYQDEMRDLTEATMRGEVPFQTSFLSRVELLSKVDVSKVSHLVEAIPLNESIANFIRNHSDRCYIVTGNLDVWIEDLLKSLNLSNQVFCSKAKVKDDKIEKVISVIDKELIARQFVNDFVVIGDGDNDSGMARYADIAIGYGGVRDIAPSLLRNIDYAFYDDKACASFLEQLAKL